MNRGRKGSDGGFHALDEGCEVRFHIGHQDLGVVNVLDHMSVQGVQVEVTGENGEQKGPRTAP